MRARLYKLTHESDEHFTLRAVALWIALNAVVFGGAALWFYVTDRPIPEPVSTPAPAATVTVAPPNAEVAQRQQGEQPVERAVSGGTSPETSAVPAPPIAAAESPPGTIGVYPVLAIGTEAFALETVDSRDAVRPELDAEVLERATEVVALPGGAVLTVTPRTSRPRELGRDEPWTIVSPAGTCQTELGAPVTLTLDFGEPDSGKPRPIVARRLEGCANQLDAAERALAVEGTHPDARYETSHGFVERSDDNSLPYRVEVDRVDGSQSRGTTTCPTSEVVRIRDESGTIISSHPGFTLEGRVLLDDRELLILESGASVLRVIDLSEAGPVVAAERPPATFWAGDPPGC